jgi:electron transport complex protein RnfC
VSLSLLPQAFAHGVHPGDHKDATAALATERMPFVARYELLLGQHIGRPSRPVVTVGQRVQRGALIAQPDGHVSTSLHAPVTGKVVALEDRRHPNGALVPAVELEADLFDPQAPPRGEPQDWRAMSTAEFVAAVQAGGIVGMGGAAFPSHVKYALPEGKVCKRLILNGAECEPYLTSDHRLMVERPTAVLEGAEILAHHLKAEAVTVGVEANKPDALEALKAAIAARRWAMPMEVRGLPVKYPQGAEKMLVKALFDVEIPAGKLPLDVGFVVNNVGTSAAMADWLLRGEPLIERVVTVSGPGVKTPSNLVVPIGTPVREVLNRAGGLTPDTRLVVMGGPMMGMPLASLDSPVLKGTSGLLAFTAAETRTADEYACVRCGRCLEACPYFLNPSRLGRLGKAGRFEEMERYFVMDCVECGSCTWACPSGVPIVQLIRVAKATLRSRGKK